MGTRVRSSIVALGLTTAALVVPAAPAHAAAGCDTPIATHQIDSQVQDYFRARGTFTCRNVYDVQTKVAIYYTNYLPPAGSWRERGSAVYVTKGDIGASTVWSKYSGWAGGTSGHWYARAWVRWKYTPSGSYTYADDIQRWDSL